MKVRSLLTLLPLVACSFSYSAFAQTTEVVCLETTYGDICLRLFPEDAPQTVANFLKYVNEGDFNNTVIHRLIQGFVMQSGGYTFSGSTLQAIARDAAVTNEFKRPNVRGTISMAKLGGDPNSATSEWFINLGDNTENLGIANNAGFTVFGEVVLNGMAVVDCIAAVPPQVYISELFEEVPFIDYIPGVAPGAASFITIEQAYVTQRDLSDPNANSACVKPVPLALGKIEGRSFQIPVRIYDKIYKVIFRQEGDPPVYVFKAEGFSIVEVKDVGQETALFADNTLSVPSLSYRDTVGTNLVFTLTNPATLEFTLQSYNGAP